MKLELSEDEADCLKELLKDQIEGEYLTDIWSSDGIECLAAVYARLSLGGE